MADTFRFFDVKNFFRKKNFQKTMTTSPGYDLFDFCGGEKCSKQIDMANKMIERYKDDKTKLYRELNCMEGEFKEKEEYIDHLRKKRSDLEKDVRNLKEKIETKMMIC